MKYLHFFCALHPCLKLCIIAIHKRLTESIKMNQKQIDFLSKKIVQITNHIHKLTDEKTDLVAGYNREIKDSKKRVKVYAQAVQADSNEKLGEVMGEFELAEFEKMSV